MECTHLTVRALKPGACACTFPAQLRGFFLFAFQLMQFLENLIVFNPSAIGEPCGLSPAKKRGRKQHGTKNFTSLEGEDFAAINSFCSSPTGSPFPKPKLAGFGGVFFLISKLGKKRKSPLSFLAK